MMMKKHQQREGRRRERKRGANELVPSVSLCEAITVSRVWAGNLRNEIYAFFYTLLPCTRKILRVGKLVISTSLELVAAAAAAEGHCFVAPVGGNHRGNEENYKYIYKRKKNKIKSYKTFLQEFLP